MKNISIILLMSLFSLFAYSEDKLKQEESTQKSVSSPLNTYSENVNKCLQVRNDFETICKYKKSEGEQIGCLLNASKEMGICFTGHGLAGAEKKILEETAELADILTQTATSLEKWASDNEDSVKDISNMLLPILNGMMNTDSNENSNNKEARDQISKFLESLQNSVSKEEKE